MSKWGLDFWHATGERVGATFLEALAPTFAVAHQNILDIDYSTAFGLSSTIAALALIKCLIANTKSDNGPSLTEAEHVTNGVETH